MADSGLEIDRALAIENFLLKLSYDRTAGDDFLREEVGAAHQDADLRANRRERCGHDLQHRGGHGVVDAAGEDYFDFLSADFARREFGQDPVDDRTPQHEAR